MRAVPALVLVSLAALPAAADSPLTSTPFHTAYADVPVVARAAERGELDHDISAYLADPGNPVDVQVAVVNALGWSLYGKRNGTELLAYLRSTENVDETRLSARQAFLVGYLLALDDYFSPERALPYLDRATKEMPRSFTVAIVRAVVRAQVALEEDWCQTWREIQQVLVRAERGELDHDLRDPAVVVIVDYMKSYQGYCEDELGQPVDPSAETGD